MLGKCSLSRARIDALIERYTDELSAIPTETLEQLLREKIRDDTRDLRRRHPELFTQIDAERRARRKRETD